jgi:DNA-binding CsgD family transcriptional regulator
MPIVTQHHDDSLTGRQKECLLLLKGGLTSKQIARELKISPRTVDQHIAVALENLGVKNRLQAISRLHDMEGLESPDSGAATPTSKPDDIARTDEFHAVRRETPPVERGPMPNKTLPIFPPIGGSPNTASVDGRIAWMIRLATFCSMLTCLVLLFILGLSEIVNYAGQ